MRSWNDAIRYDTTGRVQAARWGANPAGTDHFLAEGGRVAAAPCAARRSTCLALFQGAPSKSAGELAQSRTLRELEARWGGRQLLDCASPLPLSREGCTTLNTCRRSATSSPPLSPRAVLIMKALAGGDTPASVLQHLPAAIAAAARLRISSGATSSLCVAMCQMWPKGSTSEPIRSP